MSSQDVIVVIVAYNRKDMLLELLKCLFLFNLKNIIVIDNSEHSILDATTLYPNIIYYKTDKNIGGAGGYNIGIKKAKEIGCNFVWLLDDDSIPEVNSLEKLLDSYYELIEHYASVSYVCSKVLWANSNDECLMNIPNYKKDGDELGCFNVRKIISCSFVSVLIPLKFIERVGLPIKDYFIWFDDVEYTSRLNLVGDGFQVLNSYVRHYTKLNQGANFSFIKDDNIVKYKYGIRNMTSFYMSNYSFRKILKLFFRVKKEMSQANILVKHRMTIFFWFFMGLFFFPKIDYLD